MHETDWTTKAPPATARDAARSAGAESQPETRDGLRMTREELTELARRTVEHLVDRVDGLGDDQAWDGDFQRALEDKLLEAPPEDGHPAAEVIDPAIRDILPFSMRLDHPRFFGLIPSSPTWPGVLADFMAAAYNINVATWLTASGPSAVGLVVIDWIRGWLGYVPLLRVRIDRVPAPEGEGPHCKPRLHRANPTSATQRQNGRK